jgi:hypothetical protein
VGKLMRGGGTCANGHKTFVWWGVMFEKEKKIEMDTFFFCHIWNFRVNDSMIYDHIMFLVRLIFCGK